MDAVTLEVGEGQPVGVCTRGCTNRFEIAGRLGPLTTRLARDPP